MDEMIINESETERNNKLRRKECCPLVQYYAWLGIRSLWWWGRPWIRGGCFKKPWQKKVKRKILFVSRRPDSLDWLRLAPRRHGTHFDSINPSLSLTLSSNVRSFPDCLLFVNGYLEVRKRIGSFFISGIMPCF